MRPFGKELILDIHGCDPKTFTRVNIEKFLVDLCKRIDMNREDLHFWDYDDDYIASQEYQDLPTHLKGTSAIQFISTSNITIHTLDEMRRVYLNIFSCKSFKSSGVKQCCIEYFGGYTVNAVAVTRI